MNRLLMLMRHGKSDWNVEADDYDRPLKKRGKRAAERMGVWLVQQDLIPDHIISSPAERAADTATRVAKALGLKRHSIYFDARIYEAGTEELLATLADSPAQSQRALLIGHNPGLELLLQYLHGGRIDYPEDGKLMPTAALAVLAMPEDWSRLEAGAARLQSIIRASSLE